MELKEGMYVRFKDNKGIQYIGKLININEYREPCFKYAIEVNWYDDYIFIGDEDILKASFNLIDLIEYMDLLEIEGSIKIYGENKTVALFNPVRCDGFTLFEDGTHCIILNLDYLVDVKDLKIKSVLTKEQFDSMKYVVERDTNENL